MLDCLSLSAGILRDSDPKMFQTFQTFAALMCYSTVMVRHNMWENPVVLVLALRNISGMLAFLMHAILEPIRHQT